ncbi:futalosine hydrolase [Mucilaginibacter terrigena]|uniref:Futalosine hydrolase n=1 Tax=Mucilaginibacter terrigena TaxID=2492395 RepID=A0A4Q5LIF4_9SPHI|nr:futalosine hydrolase [Mucilaginibacter terrigena]RYU87866.1 futalosine hydrolase [Mucilaginibacter terrigena]
MRVLFVAATGMEVGRFVLDFGFRVMDAEKKNVYTIPDEKNSVSHTLLITGVGMVATAYSLGKELATNQYDLAINFGIAGSFDRSIELGDVVEIIHDNIAELGAEDNDSFLPVSVLGFGESEFKATQTVSSIFKGAKTSSLLKNLKQVRSITVNTVHGEPESINRVQKRLNPQLESMEGAAFFYVCHHAGIPCVQIRAVSNYVEKRDKDNWKIGLAVKNLNAFIVEFINGLQVL